MDRQIRRALSACLVAACFLAAREAMPFLTKGKEAFESAGKALAAVPEPDGVIDRTGFVAQPTLSLFDPVPGVIHDDPVEPGGELRLAPELPNRPVRRQKGLLHDIAGLIIVPQHPVGDVQHAFLMALDEDLEGIRIALLAQQDNTCVLVIGHPVYGSNHGVRHLW